MKSKLFVVLGALAFVSIMVSCATPSKINYSYQESGNLNDSAPIPVKDYETAGIIIVKSSEVIDSAGNHTGSKITYEMLMLEAQKLDADDVINIRIDVNQVDEVIKDNSSFISKFTSPSITKTTYNYTATALAIRYTAVVPLGNAVTYPYTGTLSIGGWDPALIPAPVAASTPDKDAWKKKWVYLGGALGAGPYEYEGHFYDSTGSHTETHTGFVFAAGAVAEVALLDFFSIELMVGLGSDLDDLYPVLPVLAKLGYRFGQMEAFANAGYTIGMGFTFGATLGVHAGPGVLFVQGLFIPDTEIEDVKNLSIGMLGYKVGIGNKS